MPGRFVAAAILLLWIGAVAWQVVRSAAAPYTAAPKLLECLRLAVEDGETTWQISHSGKPYGRTVTKIREDRTIGFIVNQQVTLDGQLVASVAPLTAFLTNTDFLRSLQFTMNMDMQVTQFGSLHRFTMNAAVHLDKQAKDGAVKAYISGVTDEGFLVLSGYFMLGERKFPLPQNVKIKHDNKNLFLSSLAPADCLPGLRPGQTWEAPVLDLSELLKNAQGFDLGMGDQFALPARKPTQVRVRDEMVSYDWHGTPTSCWLAESKQRGLTISLWVNAATGRVLRQQAKVGDTAIEMVRDPAK